MSILSIALIAMFVLFLLGLPIYAALTIAASIALLTSDILPLSVIHSSLFDGLNIFPLLAIPCFIVAGGLILLWLYNAYVAGSLGGDYDFESGKRSFAFGTFVMNLAFNALWTFAQIGLIRLFLELVINSGRKGPQA